MAESGQERTERATPKRLEEARKKGQVPRSTELSTAAVCIAAAVAIYSLGSMAAGRMWTALTGAGARALWIVLPILGATFFAALAAPIAIGGWNFSAGALMPQFSRLNPANGLGRVFSARGLVELGKGIAKVGVVAVTGWVLLRGLTPQLMGLSTEPLH